MVIQTEVFARPSAVLATIAITGFAFGLKVIESMERYAINVNLSMIVGLVSRNIGLWNSGVWQLPNRPGESDHWHALRVGLVDMQLYLPKDWTSDKRRMKHAGVRKERQRQKNDRNFV